MRVFGFHILRELPKTVVEKIVYVELGEEVEVYQAMVEGGFAYMVEFYPRWHGNIYQTCSQALSECPHAVVRKVSAYKTRGNYFTRGALRKLNVQPKPKTEKGKAA